MADQNAMRDTFRVWNFDAVEREVVLRSSDDQYVSVPLPGENADLFERLADSSGTVEATLVESSGAGSSWRVAEIHENTDGE
ncbi:hypothetical protein M0R88_06300 [Halorussus gelatinilyticus]|uniref:Uncharacterized protein n=1 Tax=Halorussus gelatinilyticus TaxID=2937524 RepID=A0A8U0INX3_9EURY|nr:hypothetical protein [Halorussus gelatinilyticus]UPW01709.1 hypothetical protein M0R88_06300 [Halorussus gelatinilyticus]